MNTRHREYNRLRDEYDTLTEQADHAKRHGDNETRSALLRRAADVDKQLCAIESRDTSAFVAHLVRNHQTR